MYRNARSLLRFSISKSSPKRPTSQFPSKTHLGLGSARQLFDQIPLAENLPRSTVDRVHGRFFSSSGSNGADHSKEIDEINMKFAEAREEIDAAMESKETVYFNEEAECAREAVKEVLDLFRKLLEGLSEGEKAAVMRSMGLKMEQLKAELKQLDE
ncbi:hypothetical protein LUZ60_009614 [Juncus effusus]|nr:hypothetical protein LUZ60_009614 [Juncus effusus]